MISSRLCEAIPGFLVNFATRLTQISIGFLTSSKRKFAQGYSKSSHNSKLSLKFISPATAFIPWKTQRSSKSVKQDPLIVLCSDSIVPQSSSSIFFQLCAMIFRREFIELEHCTFYNYRTVLMS